MRRQMTALLLVLACCVVPAAAQEKPPIPAILDRTPVMLDAETALMFGGGGIAVLTEQGPISGFAFGPGRDEVAYGAPTPEGRSGLWVVSAVFPDTTRPDSPQEPRAGFLALKTRPRLLWTAPEGTTLRGPPWWSPSGTQVAMRVFDTGGRVTVVSVDYATGQAVALTSGQELLELAWSPDAKRVALLVRTEAGPKVSLQRFPMAEGMCLADGDGDRDLHWSVDGKTLHWLKRTSAGWTERTWDTEKQELRDGRALPARDGEALFSPDGRLVAVVGGEPKRLSLAAPTSAAGEVVDLKGVHPTRLLGWSPDSHLAVILADRNTPVAVGTKPEREVRDDVIRAMGKVGEPYAALRGAAMGPPIDLEAGPPAWSSKGDLVVYVAKVDRPTDLLRWRDPEVPLADWAGYAKTAPRGTSALLAMRLFRMPLTPEAMRQQETRADEDAARTQVVMNAKQIAMALQMWVADHQDEFPRAATPQELSQLLQPYLKNEGAFLRPGTTDQAVVYLLPAGGKLADISDPAATPVVLIDYLTHWNIVGYADGHAQVVPKGIDYGQGNLPQPAPE